jgi:hypothetical protein
MADNFSQQLAQWVKHQGTRPDKNLVAFMAVRDDVKVALDAGYAVKTIWANLRETNRINLSYKTFLNYVRRVLGPPQEPAAVGPVKSEAPSASTVQPLPPTGAEPAPVRVMPLPMPGFTYNPVPNKEELL